MAWFSDLIPYAPDQNRDVEQMLLRTLLDDGLLSELVVAYEQRMQKFITSEQSKGRTALVKSYPIKKFSHTAVVSCCSPVAHVNSRHTR